MPVAVMSYAGALNDAQRIAMRADPAVFTLGEDIGEYGGVYRVTAGLLEEFGAGRVRDTPISETAITGAAVGAALVGCRPILEVGFVDFVGTCWDQIFNQAAKFRYMTGGRASVPLVVRMASGAGLGYGVHHSQSLEAWFTHVPGLKVVMPATPADAKGLLLASIEDDDPVIFLEHKALYAVRGEVPEGHYTVPLGEARTAREGGDVTVVAWSGAVAWALAAAEQAAAEGIECRVLDLRTLVPLDEDRIIDAVRDTGRFIVCHEACITGGFGAEVIARVVARAFDYLDAPPLRVAAPDIPVPASRALEAVYLQPREQLLASIREAVA